MKERERLVVSGLVVLMLLLWLGFLVHRDPRFAGSAWGGVLAVSGSILMLVPLVYMAIKRIPPLKHWVTRRVPMRTLLTWHIYAGILGPILVVLHSGHKYESPLGVALTAMTLVTVLSGFVGRYLMNQVTQDVREKREALTQLEAAYRQTAGELAAQPEQVAILRPSIGFFARAVATFFLPARPLQQSPAAVRSLRLADAMADLEYAVKTDETFRLLFARWLRLHIGISLVLYALLGLHVWAAVHYGLRWFA